jgi:pimeloyl-ACP methyl ester carboxylesterase
MKKVLLTTIAILTTLSTFAQAPTNGLVAYYPFNGNANDESPSHLNNGTVNGAILTSDRKGLANSAYNFDGSSSISANLGSDLSTTENTLSVWLVISGSGNSNPRIVGVGPSGTPGQNYALILDGTGNPRRLEYYSGQGGGINLFSTSTLSNSTEWKHITATFKNNVARFYINGVFDSQANGTNGLSTFSSSILQIGRSISGTDGFNGKLDDIRIYNRALTDTEVQALYQAEAPPIDISTSLVAHYKMDGNAQDASGNSNHGTAQNGVTFGTDRFGNAGKAASFDGVDDWISTNMQQTNIVGYTISSWVKSTDSDFTIINNRGPVNQGGKSLTLRYWEGKWAIVIDGDYIFIGKTFPYSLQNTWINITTTWDKGNDTSFSPNQFKIFINGVLVNSSDYSTGSASIPYNPNGNLKIGYHEAFSNFFEGNLDDLRIYNRALTDTEVQALYQAEVPPIDITTGLVAHYKMDGNAQDASGNSNHGTAQNGVTFGTDRFGNTGKAASFDGVDDRISVNNHSSLNFSSSFTSTFWTKMNTWAEAGNNARGIISKKPNDGSTGYVFYKDGYSQSKVNFRMKGSSAIDYNFSNSDVIINQWEFWSMVYNSTSGKVTIYKNGVLDKTINTGNIGNMTNSSPFYIGFSETWSGYFNGSIDDVRMYNRALSNVEVLTLYNSENSGVSLTTAMRLGGGLSTLNVGTGYNFTASLKNNGISSWVGDVYLKVKGGTPTLISSNNVISAGSTYNVSSTFTPQTSQIGQNISVELLTKQGTNDFIRASVVNGTVNPVLVNIEAASSVPVVRVPFIRLNQSEVNLGGTVQIIGGNFEPNTQVTIGSSPDISGAIYQLVNVATDGSINASFTVPNTFTERYLTIIGRNVKSDNPGALVLVNQPQEVATLSITKPYKANETINITPEGNVAIEFSDKLLKGSAYPQSGASRSYQYEIGYQYAGSTVYYPLKQLPVETDLLNKEIRKTVLVPMTGFSTISQSGGWVLKYIIKDLYNNQRVAESPFVNINVVQNISKISMKWDRSFSPMPSQDPIGIAADGVARMYLVLEKNSPTGSSIQSVSITLANYESNNDPTNFNNGAWLGRVKYANQQNNTQYSEEANGITTITAQNLSTNTDGKYWFWYVAPDDFTKDGAGYINDSEREVAAKFTVTYADGTVELVTNYIQVVRPPLMLVHGLNGSAESWAKSQFEVNQNIKNRFKHIKFAKLSPKEYFAVNANGLLGKLAIGDALSFGIDPTSSLPNVVQEMRLFKNYACSQVDYVAHSMGGCMLRMAEQQTNDFYVGGTTSKNYKNYSKGYVHKFISVDTPHEGSPLADLLSDGLPFLPLEATYPMTAITNISFGITGEDYTWWGNFITPSTEYNGRLTEALQYINAVPYDFITTRAVKNMEVMNGGNGVRFRQTNIKSHMIAGDVVQGTTDLTPNWGNFIISQPYYKQFFEYLETGLEFLKFDKQIEAPRPWFMDFIYFTKQNAPVLWDETWGLKENKLNVVDKLYKVTKTMKQLGLLLGNYDDFAYNGDWVVPLKSQVANMTNSQNQTIMNNSIIDFGKFHIKVTDDLPVNNKINELLNKSVNSNLFGVINASQNINRPTSLNNSGNKKPIITLQNGVKTVSLNGYVMQDRIDTNKIKILTPFNNSSFNQASTIKVIVHVKDTVRLRQIGVVFQDMVKTDTVRVSSNQNYEFHFPVKEIFLGKQFIIAHGRYIKNDTVFYSRDTIAVNINVVEQLKGFQANPELLSLNIEAKFTPKYELLYSSFANNNIDKSKLNISISNPSSLRYNTQTGQFKGLQKGEAVVVFTYDGIFKDTMYVAVGGGGVPYTQQISTSNVPVTGDGTICTGATISVPFTITGGVFDVGNQSIVQLSDASGENFVSLETTGISSPLSARIPNGLSDADTYKIRVVSTSPPVIGTVAVQPLKIRNQDSISIVSIKTGNWNDADTWSCGRVPIITNNITIAGGHTITIPNGQTGFANNLTQIGTLINAGNLRLKAEL